MVPLIQLMVAMEMLLLPAWVGAVFVPPPAGLGRRLAWAPAPVLALTAVLALVAGVAGEGLLVGVLRAQAVAAGWVVLLAGIAAVAERLAGPRAGQVFATVAGWALLAAVVLAGPAAEWLEGPAKAAVVRAVVHVNPLVVAEHELGLKWLHQSLTYRLTPMGESYAYLIGPLAWYQTLLGHAFVGSAMVVFSLRRTRTPPAPGPQD